MDTVLCHRACVVVWEWEKVCESLPNCTLAQFTQRTPNGRPAQPGHTRNCHGGGSPLALGGSLLTISPYVCMYMRVRGKKKTKKKGEKKKGRGIGTSSAKAFLGLGPVWARYWVWSILVGNEFTSWLYSTVFTCTWRYTLCAKLTSWRTLCSHRQIRQYIGPYIPKTRA